MFRLRLWGKRREELKELVEFSKRRAGFAPVVKLTRPKLRLWSSGPSEEVVERLQTLVASASRIQAIFDAEGWTDILEAKLYYQSLYDWKTKTPSLPEQERFQAACEWAALEGFFMELTARVKRGREASKELAKVLAKA